MEKDTTYTVNRQELIKMARESCEENLKAIGNGKFTYGMVKKQSDKGGVMKKRTSSTTIAQAELSRRQQSIRSILVRTSIACVLMLGVVVVDRCNLSYKNIDMETVKSTVESNAAYEQVENFFNTDTGKQILAVFNRRD